MVLGLYYSILYLLGITDMRTFGRVAMSVI